MEFFMLNRTSKRKLVRLTALLLFTTCVVYGVLSTRDAQVYVERKSTQHIVYDENQKEYVYDRNSPLIFVGGFPRSGTTLMRALLDAHPDVRCGEETRLIPNLLQSRHKWVGTGAEKERLLEAGIDDEVIQSAFAAFILEIMARHGEPAKRLCNKDPFVLSSLTYMRGVFPKGKYILMIRDGRASVYSMITRHVTITGYNMSSYRDCLIKWSLAIEKMYYQCLQEGPKVCLPVYYEQLVLHSEDWMRKILEFLEIPWDDVVLHHEETVGKPGGISLSKTEHSTDQVIKPINKGALTTWVGHLPPDVVADIDAVAPMLMRLGYDTHSPYPNYDKHQGDMNLWNGGLVQVEMEKLNNLNMRDIRKGQRAFPRKTGVDFARQFR